MSHDPLAGMIGRLEFCRQLRIDQRTAWNWRQTGYGPQPRRIGTRLYYVQSEVDEFVRTSTTRPSVVA